MKMIMLLAAVFLIIIIIEAPKLIINKYWKELIAFLSLLSLAFALTALVIFDVDIPSPLEGIEYLIDDILGLSWDRK
ncbi:MAG: hypothetical protein APF84_07945 [Gracilibacter sp. BRH_c7a]|nr:MAG: hypothetical protein APF84_07945 [Gracilibacter sp. BRH_c7a]